MKHIIKGVRENEKAKMTKKEKRKLCDRPQKQVINNELDYVMAGR